MAWGYLGSTAPVLGPCGRPRAVSVCIRRNGLTPGKPGGHYRLLLVSCAQCFNPAVQGCPGHAVIPCDLRCWLA